MALQIVTGTANPALGAAIAAAIGQDPAHCEVERFPDGELRPRVGTVRGDDVYVVQPTAPPVNEHLVELLLLLDACGRAGADRLTAVIPYFGYARQDRRSRAGEAVGARVAIEAIAAAGAKRLVVVDAHTPALEAMSPVPVELLTAVPVLARDIRADIAGEAAVVVAPDLGAVKLAERYAALLGASVAVIRKTRLAGTAVRAEEIVGDVEGRPAIVVDDMISTGGTVEAAIRLLLAQGAPPRVVVATHGLFVGDAPNRLRRAAPGRLVVTDSVMGTAEVPADVCSIGPLLADAIARLHHDRPLDDLLAGG